MDQGQTGRTLLDAGRARPQVNTEPREIDSLAERLAVVALGSNLGESQRTIRAAIGELEKRATRTFRSSSLWRTNPVQCPPGSPCFINAVVMFEARPDETPESLLIDLQAIEQKSGRTRSGLLNEARTLDLDLIAFGREQRDSPELILPHPRAHLRKFVLDPLAEILPQFQAPGWRAAAHELAASIGSNEILEKVGE